MTDNPPTYRTGDPRVDVLTLNDHLDAIACSRFWARGDLASVRQTLEVAGPNIMLATISLAAGWVAANASDTEAALDQAAANYRKIYAMLADLDGDE